MNAVRMQPPKIEQSEHLPSVSDSISPGVYQCGNSWLRKNRAGLYELYLEGKPFEVGYYNGVLTRSLLKYQEFVFVERLKEMIPSEKYLNFLKYFIAWFNRDMDDFVPLELQEEIYGVSLSASEEYSFIAPNYQRILNYHAAHDIGHAMENMNLVGCTALAVWDDKSADSSLIIGRNFDFYMGDEFSRNKIVTFIKPDKGYKMMLVTWGGMTGVVSGMNEKGLTVTLNSAKSDIPWKARTPVSILARMILQYASNIKEAVEIADKSQTFVSESFLIGSAIDRKAVVIEKSTKKSGVYSTPDSHLILTNHFQSNEFKDDPDVKESIKDGASLYRYERVKELIYKHKVLDVSKTASILRNKKGLNNTDIGLGNEKSIDQLICHHSIIFKPEQLLVWVSTAPYQEGQYICYDLNKIFSDTLNYKNEIDELQYQIPADTFLKSEAWSRYRTYVSKTTDIQKRLKKKETHFLSKKEIDDYLSLNFNYYYPHFLVATYYYQEGIAKLDAGSTKHEKIESFNDPKWLFSNAKDELNIALKLEIPRKVEKDHIMDLLDKVKKESSKL